MTKKASVAIIAVMVAVALVALGTTIITRSVSEINLSRRFEISTQGFWLAEAGLNSALSQLAANWYDRAPGNANLGNGTYNFTITDTDGSGNPLMNNQLRIVSIGLIPASSVSRSIEVIVQDRPTDKYKYAVLGVGLVELKSGATVHGDIYVDGDIEVQAGARVVRVDDLVMPIDPVAYDANIYYTGSVTGMGGVVEGALISTGVSIPAPTFDFDQLKADADYIIPGGTKLSGHLANGVYYVTGNVELNNVTLDEGAIIADDMIEVSGGLDINLPVAGFPSLANKAGTIEVDDTANIRGLLYCSDAGVELKTGSTMVVEGSVIAAGSGVEIKTSLGDLQIYHKEEFLLRLPDSALGIHTWEDKENPYILVP